MSPLHLLLALFLFHPSVDASSEPQLDFDTVHWKQNPNTRGTLTIIFSCGAALALCIWTGVHLNVEGTTHRPAGRILKHKFVRRSIWAFIALIAPDIVLTVAFHQFLAACQYRKMIAKRMEREGKMKIKIAYFALMGGFSGNFARFDGSRNSNVEIDYICGPQMMTTIYNYPLAEIQDKSKASGLEKFIAVVQTGWILLQCCGRQLEGLHICLLEINTAIHVLIAIAMYAIWWEKPVDINNAIEVERQRNLSPGAVDHVNSLRRIMIKAEDEISYRLVSLGEKNEPVPEEQDTATIYSLLRSIREVPDEAVRRYRAIPRAIKQHYKQILRRHFRLAVLQHIRMLSQAPGDIQIAANREASITADREVSRLLSNGFITSRIIRTKIGPSGNVLEEFSPSLLGGVIHETTRELLSPTLESAREEANAMHERQPSVTPELPEIVAAIATLGAARTAARRAVRQAFLDFVSGYDARAASNAAEDGFRAVNFGSEAEINKASAIVSKVVYRFVRSQGSSTAGGISGHTASVDALYKATATAICYATLQSVNTAIREFPYQKIPTSPNVHMAFEDYVRAEEEKKWFREKKLAELNKVKDILSLAAVHTDGGGISENYRWRQSLQSLGEIFLSQVIRVPGLCKPVCVENGGQRRLGSKLRSGLEHPSIKITTESVFGIPFQQDWIHDSKTDTFEYDYAEPFQTTIHLSPESLQNSEMVFGRTWRTNHRTFIAAFTFFSGAFYSALHASKWNSQWFPTPTEQLLWRISCCVGAFSVIPVVLLIMAPFSRCIWKYYLLMTLGTLFWIIFAAARVFIIVEGFLCLRRLPNQAYKTVLWTNIIPHV